LNDNSLLFEFFRTRECLDWEDLIQIAATERVLPSLRSLGGPSQFPGEVANFLSAVEDLNFERNEAILEELATVASLLNEAGIEPVLLKGVAYLLTGVYANPATRYLWDVDLLIPEPQLPSAVEVLGRNGFASDQNYRLGFFRHHHPPLKRPGSVHFELHHRLGMGICQSLLPASEVLAQSALHDFQGARVRIPSPEHLMAHLIMHSQVQHSYNERIWPPIRAMYDLTLLRRRFDMAIDWTSMQLRFRRARQSAVLALHLLQVREVLGLQTPFPIRLTGLTYLRWFRRKLLRELPALRFIDPIYMYSTVMIRRLRLLRNVLAAPGGLRHVAREFLAPGIYQRLLTDIIEGHGR
jgi:hypothetical protein